MAITDNDHQGGVIGNEGSSSVQSSNGGQEYGGLSEEVDSIPEQSNNQEIQAIGFNDEGEFAQDTEGGPATPQAENIGGANPTLPSNTRHAVERTDGCIDTIKEATMEEADESDDSSLSELSDANDTSEDPGRTPTLNTNTPAPPTACLPNHIFIAAQGKDYDRQWMVKHNVDAAPLQSFTSKQKLDHLMIHGAVKAGDRLRVTIDHGQGAHDVEGEVNIHDILIIYDS